MAVGERQQEGGREGVMMARSWLDRTTRVKIEYTAYDWPDMVVLKPLAGAPKGFDLLGKLLDENGRASYPLLVEVKHYLEGAGDQGTQYRQYLANCYSVVAAAQDDGMDKGWQFMWLTWHPFNVTTWTKLLDAETVETAVREHRDTVLDGRDIDEALCKAVADRLWLVVLGPRHEELMIPKWLMSHVRSHHEARSGS